MAARIKKIDVSKALKVPGVRAIVTSEDCKGLSIGKYQGILADGIVRYIGEDVAAVAAGDEATAAEAAALIEIEYEPLPAVHALNKATWPQAPILHPGTDDNLALLTEEVHGEPDRLFDEAFHIREDDFESNPSHNCFAEFHSVVADYSQAGKLTVWTPSQSALMFQKSFATTFGLSDGNVRVMCLNTGGAFTGRTGARPHHFVAAVLSKKAARPVKITASGDEEFIMCRAGGKNHYNLRSGVDKDGIIKVIEADFLFDCGAFMEAQALVTMLTSKYLHMLFPLEHSRYRGRLVYTNNMPYYFHHGGGLAQMQFAFGQHVDLLARDMNIDPVEFLLKNAVETGHTTVTGIHYASCGLSECIEKAAAKSDWRNKRGKSKPYRGIGIGIGAMASGGARGPLGKDTSAAFIKVMDDGSASLFTGLPDMGQSSHTAMAIIAAEVLGIDATDIQVISGDTDVAPFDIGAFSQRGTFVTGNAVMNACNDVREQLSKVAIEALGVEEDDLVFRDKSVYGKDEPSQSISFSDLVKKTMGEGEGRPLMGRGFFTSPRKSGAMAYSFGAQIAEVEVEPDTGIVKVLHMTAAHDVGRALNPRVVQGQMDGQIFSGMSQVLYEECEMDGGQILNPSRLEYKMPRSYEVPEVDHIIVESIDPFGPFGAKEVGEGPIVCTLQAIANAVADAIGHPVKEMPITPWRVMQTMKSAAKSAGKKETKVESVGE